jgi:hypothetical protein
MRYRSRFSRAVLVSVASFAAGLLPLAMQAESPIIGGPPPKAFIETLDLLSRGNVSPEELAKPMGALIDQKYGNSDYGIIVREAILDGVISKQVAIAALEEAGCSRDSTDLGSQCGRLAAYIRDAGTGTGWDRRAPGKQPERAKQLEEARSKFLTTIEKHNTARLAGYDYAAELIAAAPNPLAEALRLILVQTPNELPDQERRVLLLLSEDKKGPPAITYFRELVAHAYSERILNSMAYPEIVQEVRWIPDDLLERVHRINSSYVFSFFSPGVGCVETAWRTPAAAPNRWQAWKNLMQCGSW